MLKLQCGRSLASLFSTRRSVINKKTRFYYTPNENLQLCTLQSARTAEKQLEAGRRISLPVQAVAIRAEFVAILSET